MKAAHDQGNRAAADVIPAAAVIIGYATLTHIYDSKDCSTVLHKCMLSRKFFLLRENYTTMCFKPIIRIRTPVKQYAHTGSIEIRTPMRRNLHFNDLRINDRFRIINPVLFHLFTRVLITMHGNIVLLFVLMNIISKLRIHKFFFDISTTVFHVFYPQKFFIASVTK